MTVKPPLDPSKVASGSWEVIEDSWSKTSDWIDYGGSVNVDFNGDSVGYGTYGSFGVWKSAKSSGYSGWFWSHDVDFEFEGVSYDHDAIIVIDADSNLSLIHI